MRDPVLSSPRVRARGPISIDDDNLLAGMKCNAAYKKMRIAYAASDLAIAEVIGWGSANRMGEPAIPPVSVAAAEPVHAPVVAADALLPGFRASRASLKDDLAVLGFEEGIGPGHFDYRDVYIRYASLCEELSHRSDAIERLGFSRAIKRILVGDASGFGFTTYTFEAAKNRDACIFTQFGTKMISDNFFNQSVYGGSDCKCCLGPLEFPIETVLVLSSDCSCNIILHETCGRAWMQSGAKCVCRSDVFVGIIISISSRTVVEVVVPGQRAIVEIPAAIMTAVGRRVVAPNFYRPAGGVASEFQLRQVDAISSSDEDSDCESTYSSAPWVPGNRIIPLAHHMPSFVDASGAEYSDLAGAVTPVVEFDDEGEIVSSSIVDLTECATPPMTTDGLV
jgi:hypothetical protein